MGQKDLIIKKEGDKFVLRDRKTGAFKGGFDMSGSVKQARKGLRPHKGTKSVVIGPQTGSQGKAIGTNVRDTANPRG